MGDLPADDALDTDDRSGAPALVTMGLTPDTASPTEGEPAGEPVAPARGGRIARLFTEPMWVLGLVLFMDEVDKNVVRGMITPLKEDFGVGDLGIGVLLSLALLFNGLITVPAGYLADRWNRSRAIGQTVVGWSVLTAGGAASVGFPKMRPPSETAVSTPSTGRSPASAATERALPSACSVTSRTAFASGGSCSS